jgi:thioester reductase-like protein
MSVESDKITTHSGEFVDPMLSLNDAALSDLATEIDIIIISGPNHSFWNYYQCGLVMTRIVR